jgi:pentapeptide MXKDX repeat protein
MRKLIIATTALAFLSSTAALAQDKAGSTPPAAGDTMSKGDDMSKDKMGKKSSKKTAKKSSKMKSDDTTK